jgi:hypothetical protein
MKVEKQKLYRQLSSLAVLSTIALCTVFAVAHNDYTYSMQDVSEGKIEVQEGDDPSSSVSIDTEIRNKVNEVIENKKEKDAREYAAYLESLVVYDGLTMDELSAKLEKNLHSTLDGTGKLFAEYSIKLGLDPYLAVSIVLLETGCNWECSELVKQCNNVGGVKGSPGCFGGSYQKYSSLEEGITSYLDLLYNNYYSKGLTTPEQINPKYAASTTWASKVNKYIEKIKAS